MLPRKVAVLVGALMLSLIVLTIGSPKETTVAGAAQQITLTAIGTFNSGIPFGGALIVAHDPETQRLFVVNAPEARIDVLDISDPTKPAALTPIDVLPYGAAPNSVAIHGGVVAVAVGNEMKTEPGKMVFFNTEGQFLNSVTVGALPDMLTFTPNGRKVLVANEGEPNDDYTVDPEGSVSIIDASAGAANITQDDVCTADFREFNDAELDPRIRIFGPNASVAQDLEPEYTTASDDSTRAWVTLQENNALAILDLEACEVTDLVALGFKDHNLPGNGLDASDADGTINITIWPVQGMYQPDGIGSYRFQGATYLITANEGDSRDYPGFSEETRVADLTLDPTAFPDAANLQQEDQLGRLKVTNATGDTDGDGDLDRLLPHGARSFSIWTEDGELVFDSGDAFEQITAEEFPDGFNAQDAVDDRSDDKGPEPEGIVLGEASGRTYAFIGLERTGGIMVYDISDPLSPSFVQYINTRILGGDPGAGTAGDVAPEGLIFIRGEDSPNGSPLLVVAYEVSGTTTIFEIAKSQDYGD
jgi:2',3'-cyclic-nucleotide 2'-phosphodiesterase/3'-nucleotidase/5'-nucleotidase